jgi:MoaA/NifB/PqqE/SkfB family radical SAM enzyme
MTDEKPIAMRPCASWNVVGQCNYTCSYCVQKPETRKGIPTREEVEKFLAAWDALPGRWEFKMSGGEPFLLKSLPEVALRLARRGHQVSVLTNLSAPKERIAAFVEASGTSLRTFSTSLHREMIGEAEFLEKIVWLRRLLDGVPRATLVVNSVLVPGELDRLYETKIRFEAAGIKYYPQMMRVDGKNYRYSDAEWEKVLRIIGARATPREVNMGYSFTGKPCWAGARYFIVTHRGNAYSCYPGKRTGKGFLGNVLKGTFRLWHGQHVCIYDVCPCTVPQNRGIVDARLGVRVAGEESPTVLLREIVARRDDFPRRGKSADSASI